jgi:hypothetical protein
MQAERRIANGDAVADRPRLSVIIPCYRQAHWLPQALASLAAQPGVAWEAIVVDDGSPDDVAGACARCPQVVYHRQDNAGLSAARNAGIGLAKGEFLHFLDADDLVAPGMYAAMVRALDAHPQYTAVVCGTSFLREDGTPFDYRWEPPPPGLGFRDLVNSNRFPVGAAVLRRSALDRVGLFDPALRGCEDWDLWLRLARAGAVFGVVAGCYFRYRRQSSGMSREAVRMFAAANEVLARGRRPDPRVAQPVPEFANGVDAADLDRWRAFHAAASLGKALGGGDVEGGRELVGLLPPELLGLPLELAFFSDAVVLSAAHHCGVLPPDNEEIWDRCWPTLLGITGCFPPGSPARRWLSRMALVLSGAVALKAERDLWKTNCKRLASALPVKWMLWLRRRLLGLKDPLQ